MNHTIRAGQTFALTGVLDAGNTLTALAPGYGFTHGALVQLAAAAATNNGLLMLSGGTLGRPQPGAVQGARLLNHDALIGPRKGTLSPR